MKTIVRLLLLAIIGIPMIAFALVNKDQVPIRIDPIAGAAATPVISLPLFVVVFAALLLGVFLGGLAAWIGQGKHRKAARVARADLVRLKAETAANAIPANDR